MCLPIHVLLASVRSWDVYENIASTRNNFFFFFKKRKTAMSLLGTNGLDSDLDGYLFIILVNSAKVLFLVALASLFVRWLAGKLKKL